MSTTTGPGTPGAREVEGLVDRARDLQRRADLEGVLDDRHRDAERVGLLEAVGADQVGAHLAGDEHRRHRVHHRVDDRRHDVRRARAGGRERDADLAGRLRVALGGVAAAGLVAHEDVADAGVDERVVGGRLAPPGRPNTTSTPSAFKHSMMASTARMSRPPLRRDRPAPRPARAGQSSVGARRQRSAGAAVSDASASLGELELGPAAHAERVVELADAPARRALAAQLVALGAIADRGEQPEDRDRRRRSRTTARTSCP